MNPQVALASRIVLVARRAGLRAWEDNPVDLLVRVQASDVGDWPTLDPLPSEIRGQFAQNAWMASIVESMIGLARECSHKRVMQESMHASGRLHRRLVARDEIGDPHLCIADGGVPAFPLRESMLGENDL